MRQRLARDLHDAVSQSLYSLTLFAEAGREFAQGGEWERAQQHLAWVGEIAQQALKEMRLLIYQLRPPALATEGLGVALQRRLEAVRKLGEADYLPAVELLILLIERPDPRIRTLRRDDLPALLVDWFGEESPESEDTLRLNLRVRSEETLVALLILITGLFFMMGVLEYIRGRSLGHLLNHESVGHLQTANLIAHVAAALQHAQAGPAPVLIRIETRAGHGMGKPTAKLIEEAGDVHFLTMEMVEGRNLAEVIEAGGVPMADFFDLAVPLAAALFEGLAYNVLHMEGYPERYKSLRELEIESPLLECKLTKADVHARDASGDEGADEGNDLHGNAGGDAGDDDIQGPKSGGYIRADGLDFWV